MSYLSSVLFLIYVDDFMLKLLLCRTGDWRHHDNNQNNYNAPIFKLLQKNIRTGNNKLQYRGREFDSSMRGKGQFI